MGEEGARRELARLAGRRLGIVTYDECRQLGRSRSWIAKQVRSGVWQQLHRGVFKVTLWRPTLEEREVAALLACGPGAVLSHRSAARWLKLPTDPATQIHVSVPAQRAVSSHDGIEVWRSRSLLEGDVETRGPIRFTRLARTVVDLSCVLDGNWLRAAVDGAVRQRRSHLDWIRRTLDARGRGRQGAARLRSILDGYELEAVPDSALESLAMELGLAIGRKPRLHLRIPLDAARSAEVDLAWPEVKLCVELDGYAFHASREAFHRDRARDRSLIAQGWTVLRFTWADVTGFRQRTITQLAAAHARCVAGHQR